MSISVNFGLVSKKKNSTYQPTTELSATFDVVLKDGTSITNPTFILSAETFPYNYCKWGSDYFYVVDVVHLKNNLFAVSCTIDVLATFKSDITSTTAFVSYADSSTDTWTADTRIPIMKSTSVASASAAAPFLASGTGGLYILSVVGDEGSALFAVNESQIRNMINDLQTWMDETFELASSISEDNALIKLAEATRMSGAIGNAYGNAPQCIRSCIWTPFVVPGGGSGPIKLGSYDTGISAITISSDPITGSVSIAIPWQNQSGWRRSSPYTQIYLYLPFVGNVAITSDNITHASALTVDYSYTLTDGNISYMIKAGGEIIGTYGGSCASNYPIGINQQSSLGDVASAVIGGVEKTTSGGIIGALLNPAGKAADVAASAYNIANTAMSTNVSCIGGIGGGAGSGLSHSLICYSIKHPTTEDDLVGVLGKPLMKKTSLSTLSGYVQCAGAHVEAAAHGDEINQIDAFINSGFFIE